MTDSLPKWLQSKKHILKVEFRELSVIKDWMPNWYDVITRFKFEGREYFGRGQDTSYRGALLKSCGEAVERLAVEFSTASSSNGFAAHTNLQLAKKSARLEVIERDQFLCHMLTHQPFKDISDSAQIYSGSLYPRMKKKLAPLGIDLKLGLVYKHGADALIICTAFGEGFDKPFGLVIGLGCRTHLREAIDKSVLECWTSLLPVLYNIDEGAISRKKLNRLKHIDIDHHRRLGLHIESAPKMRSYFEVKSQSTMVYQNRIFQYETFNSWPDLFKDCPVKIVRCSSPDMQPLFFGYPNHKVVNRSRLNQFLKSKGRSPNQIDLNCIHYLS